MWRALKGEGSSSDTLVIPETDRILGHDAKDAESQDWTIEAWFMPTADNASGSILRRAGKDSTGEEQYYFDMGLKDGKPYVRATMKGKWQIDATNFTSILEVTAENGVKARKNVWTHYAATWNSARNVLTLYINGVFAGSRYSIGDGLVDVDVMIEKPAPAEAPSRLAVASRYLLSPSIFPALERTPRGKGNEIQLTDAMRSLLGRERLIGCRIAGARHDIGDKLSFLKNTVEFALRRPEFREDTSTGLQRVRHD